MPNRIRRAAMAALACAFSVALPCLAWAEPAAPDPRVQITPAQASTFFSAFTALAQQAHVMVVAEDQPLHPALTPQAIAELKLDKDGEPLSTLLPKLAAAYDYEVQPSGKAFLLKKRYTDAADLPSVTVKECALGLTEMNGYADNFNPHLVLGLPDRSPAIRDLIYSLTPEQIEAMGDIHRGVPVTSLSPVQQQEVWQFLLHLYVQTAITDLPNTVGAINRVAATDPRFSWRDLASISSPLFVRQYPQTNASLFGYDATLANGKPVFVTMSKPSQVKGDLDGVIRLSFGSQVMDREAGAPPAEAPPEEHQIEPGDLTDPVPAPANAPPPASPISSSLGDILTQINIRAAGLKGDGLKVTVEPYLAPKRATVFGEEATTPRQEVAALAEVYGLRVFTDEKEGGHDRLRLMRQTARVPLDMSALHDSLLQSLPDPLVRAYRMHPTYVPFNFNAPRSPIPSGLSPLLVYAVRQIRTAAEPKIRASKDGRVALSALSEQEGRAFAIVLMADALDSLRGLLTADLPKELTHFSDLRLSGGLHDDQDGKKRLTLLLALPNPNDPSTLQAGMGVGEINYDPINHTF